MMNLKIMTPEKTIFNGDITKITLPGRMGKFQVLKDHAPIVSTLTNGNIVYVHEQKEYTLAIEEGMVEVKNNKLTVLMPSECKIS